MSILKFFNKKHEFVGDTQLETFVNGYSIEVMPRTLAKVDDLTGIFPDGTRVYIAHIEGTKIEDMVSTAKRLNDAGYEVMPHFPARLIANPETFENWLKMYRDAANVTQALLLAGGITEPMGSFDNSMELVETGLLDKTGYKRMHFAGHPEGNKDIDADQGSTIADKSLSWKQAFSDRSDAEVALVTQFVFDAAPVVAWSNRIADAGVDLPIHIGLAGPAKLQTLIKFALACGVGPSLKVLQKRAMDVKKLLMPYTPDQVALELARHVQNNFNSNIEQVHLFPLGGIRPSAAWARSTQKIEEKLAIA